MNRYIINGAFITKLTAITNIVNSLYEDGQLDKRYPQKHYIKKWYAYSWMYEHNIHRRAHTDIDLHYPDNLPTRIKINLIWVFTKKRK